MPPRRSSARKASKAPKAEPEVIELSSDSEPETTETPQPKEQEEQEEHGTEQIETKVATPEVYDQPLLRAAGIRYKSDKLTERQQQQQQQPQQQQQEEESTPDAKLAVRFKETGSVKHRHVSIEIPVQSPSSSKSKVKDDGATDNHNDHEQEVFKTPMERRHITFDESDHDEFVTPSDFPKKNPLEIAAPPQSNTRADTVQDSAEEVDDDSDDEAPEAVSTRVAEAQTKAEASKAAQAAAKAAEKEAAVLKRKRQERDAIFKQQAKERKQVLEQEKRQAAAAEELALGRGEKSAGEVPKLLPLELLESDDEDEDEADRAESGGKGLNKRRKLDGSVQRLLRESRAPRDKQVGSTVYRVVASGGDARQAPKAKKHSMDLKATLLRRDRKPQASTGFFVKKR